MTVIVRRNCHSFDSPVEISPGGDLWRYLPMKDANDRPPCDLMMLLPGLKQERTLSVIIRHQLQEVLEGFGDRILFADLNVRLGIFWVTVTSEPGLCGEVADAIRGRIESARVVGNYIQCPQALKLPWMERVKRLLT